MENIVDKIVECLRKYGYVPIRTENDEIVVDQFDNSNQPYKVVITVIYYDAIQFIVHYLPSTVGDAVHCFDRTLLERNSSVTLAHYDKAPDADEYRITARLEAGFNCSSMMAVLLDILALMSYRGGDTDDAIDPHPKLDD
jgi:hypothetical protein